LSIGSIVFPTKKIGQLISHSSLVALVGFGMINGSGKIFGGNLITDPPDPGTDP
jgi:hypothetical protein